MRLTLGLIIMLIGGAIVVTGIVLALLSLGGLYEGFVTDAMDQPDDAVETTQQGMYRGVIIGGIGIVPFLIGSMIVKGSVARKLIRARHKSRSLRQM